jgi:CBS-domain-containing membrane protein
VFGLLAALVTWSAPETGPVGKTPPAVTLAPGRRRKAVLDADPSARAEHVMEAGPSTVRPDRPLAELAERLRRRGLHTAIVTTPDGRLLGVVQRGDMEARLAG